MRKFISFTVVLICIIIMSGCAKRYYTLNPTSIAYSASNNMEDISLSYRYDVLNEKGNYKISKKEKKNNIKLVAVKITNNTDKVISIGNNAAFYSGNFIIYPMDAMSIKNKLKQSVPSHLLYLLLTPLTFTFNDSGAIPVGLIVGPAIAGGNMLMAGNANKRFYEELLRYDIMSIDIRAGETVYGLVGFQSFSYDPLTIKLLK